MGNFYKVTPDVLIPRDETELVTRHAIDIINSNGFKTVLDIGTGSGCIACSISELCRCKVTALDISSKALEVTRKNVDKLIGDNDTFRIVESDLFDNIDGRFSIIVCNPPYIPTKDIDELEIEVRKHDPFLALDGDEDGLSFYRRIIPEAREYLKPDGYLCFEIGYNQGEPVSRLMIEKVPIQGYNGTVFKHFERTIKEW